MRTQNPLFNLQISVVCLGVLFFFETTLRAFDSGPQAPISTVTDDEAIGAPIKGVLESLGVFKNGIVVVRERFHVPKAGVFYVVAPPSPVHGTFFIQSDVPIETRSRDLKIDVPITEERIDWVADFNGAWLSVVLPGEKEARVVRVLQSASSLKDDAVRVQDGFSSVGLSSRYIPAPVTASKSVLLQCESGETIWLADSSSISSVVLKENAPSTVSRVKPVILFDIKEVDSAQGATFYLSYLTRQASWAPQYRAVLKDEKTLEIEQSAILINDWRDFEAESTFLYSGFPQIPLKDSLSPMAPGVDLVQFFNGLNRAANGGQISEPAFMTQMTMNSVSPLDLRNDISLPTFPEEKSEGDGVDIYTQPVGAKTLKKGERALFTVDKKTTEYRRIVRWDIFDTRDSNGRVGSPQNSPSYGRTTTGQADGSMFTEPWDAIVFRNPFSFPTTTGPVAIFSTDSFLGQNSLYWRNPGEKTFLPVTKALGIRVNSFENERVFTGSSSGQELSFDHNYLPILHEDAWGNIIRINGNRYRCAVVDTTIEIDNQRNEIVEMDICRRVTGIPIKESFDGFDSIPELTRLSEHKYFYYNVNPLSEASWTMTLKPKEKRVLKFSYQALVLL